MRPRRQSGSGRLLLRLYHQRLAGRTGLFAVQPVHAGHYLCRCAQRRRARLQGDDAGAGGAVAGHCGLLCHPSRCTGGCEVFSGAQPQKLLLDDRSHCHGADVLLAVHRHGYSGHLRLLYEEGRFHRGVHRERGGVRYRHCHHGRSDDHSGGVCLLRRRPGHPAGRPCTDVHYHPQGVCKHGSGYRGGRAVLCAGAVCSHYQLHCPDRERCFHL